MCRATAAIDLQASVLLARGVEVNRAVGAHAARRPRVCEVARRIERERGGLAAVATQARHSRGDPSVFRSATIASCCGSRTVQR